MLRIVMYSPDSAFSVLNIISYSLFSYRWEASRKKRRCYTISKSWDLSSNWETGSYHFFYSTGKTMICPISNDRYDQWTFYNLLRINFISDLQGKNSIEKHTTSCTTGSLWPSWISVTYQFGHTFLEKTWTQFRRICRLASCTDLKRRSS